MTQLVIVNYIPEELATCPKFCARYLSFVPLRKQGLQHKTMYRSSMKKIPLVTV